MKIVVIGSFYTKYLHDIIFKLYNNNIHVDKVLLGTKAQRVLFKFNSLRRVKKRNGLLDIILRYQLKKKHTVATTYSALETIKKIVGFEIDYFAEVNSGKVLSILSAINDDKIIILAGSGIVDKAFLSTAGDYCINGHPAWLPGYRGVDVVDWALLDGKKVGVSSHFVTQNVDAGSIIVRKHVPMKKNELYADFRERVNEYQAEVVVEAVMKIIHNKLNNLIENDVDASKMCFAASAIIQRKAIKLFNKQIKNL